MEVFVESCRRQYRQSFTMLRQVVELCPDELWDDGSDEAAFWQQLYHVLLITDGYATGVVGDLDEVARRVLNPPVPAPGEPPFKPLFDKVSGLMTTGFETVAPLTRQEALALLDDVETHCDEALVRDSGRDASDPASNPFPHTGSTAYDKHIYNLRHVHHHLGRLNGLLRRKAGIANPWVGEKPPTA